LIAQDHPLSEAADLLLEVRGLPHSSLSFRFQIREGATGSNRDGRIEPGERVEIPLTVTNTGPAALSHVRAGLVKRPSAERVAIPAGRFELGEFAPGASKTVTFAVVIPPGTSSDHLDLRIGIEPSSSDTTDYPIRINLSGPRSTVAANAAEPATVEVTPPRLAVRGPAVVASDTVRIEGSASGEHGVHDIYIRLWNRHLKIPVRKVFYRLNSPADAPEMAFEADVPLAPGMNLLQVFARQSVEATSMQTLVIMRTPTATATAGQ
jgi:hypothetical protein